MAAPAPALSRDRPAEQNRWQGIRLVNAYRILLAFALVAAAVTGIGPETLGQQLPHLFAITAWAYLILAVGFEFLLELRVISFKPQIHLHSLTDILVLMLLMHSTGHAAGGVLGLLLVIAVAMSAALVQGRTALFYAALAALGILVQTSLSIADGVLDVNHFTAAGALGLALFTVTGLVSTFSRRAAGLEELSARREREIARMSELSLQILEQFENGVLVLDSQGRIEYGNTAAMSLLDGEPSHPPRRHAPLKQLSEELSELFSQWRLNPDIGRGEVHHPQVMHAQFKSLNDQRTLLVLTDQRRERERAQQAKLAALGRLTASIAHEIRNPLSSIQHASELLAETSDQPQTRKLSTIVVSQSQRINTLVSNVLDIARQPRVHRHCLDLGQWLREYVELNRSQWQAEQVDWTLELPELPVPALVDPTHLAQIVDNLIRNAMEHGRDETGRLSLRLSAGSRGPRRAWLKVADSGPGIDKEQAEHLYEPFFTTSTQGTGLGLYICRELAQANQGTLALAEENAGSCFILTLTSKGQGAT